MQHHGSISLPLPETLSSEEHLEGPAHKCFGMQGTFCCIEGTATSFVMQRAGLEQHHPMKRTLLLRQA